MTSLCLCNQLTFKFKRMLIHAICYLQSVSRSDIIKNSTTKRRRQCCTAHSVRIRHVTFVNSIPNPCEASSNDVDDDDDSNGFSLKFVERRYDFRFPFDPFVSMTSARYSGWQLSNAIGRDVIQCDVTILYGGLTIAKLCLNATSADEMKRKIMKLSNSDEIDANGKDRDVERLDPSILGKAIRLNKTIASTGRQWR